MSAMAGPAFGLTSSIDRVVGGPAPAPVNHWSATGGAQSTAASGADCERPATRPGARSPVPVTTTGPVPARRSLTRPERTRTAPAASPSPTWTSPVTFVPGSAPRVLTPEQVRARPGQRAGHTTDAEVERRLDRRLTAGLRRGPGAAAAAPAHRRPAARRRAPRRPRAGASSPTSGPCVGAHRAPAPRGSPTPWRTSSPIRSHDRGPSRSLADSGRSTCQARVLRSSALACTSPPVASSAAATSPSAGAGSTTYSMPRSASASTASGVGPRGQPAHQGGEVGVLAGERRAPRPHPW